MLTLVILSSLATLGFLAVWTIQRWRRIISRIEPTNFDRKLFWSCLAITVVILLVTLSYYYIFYK